MNKKLHYLRWKQVEKELREKELTVFSLVDFLGLFDVKKDTAKHFLSSHIREGDIESLKKGLYALPSPRPHLYYLANRLYRPSYISLETALSFYNLIPEIVYSVTSVTTKNKQELSAFEIRFVYRHIKREAFTGYEPMKEQGEVFYIADREKALVDYLYFVILGKKKLNDRLKITDIDREKAHDYAGLFKRDKLHKLLKKL